MLAALAEARGSLKKRIVKVTGVDGSVHLENATGEQLEKVNADSADNGSQDQCALQNQHAELANTLHLAGNPLEAPRLHPTGWKANQAFSANDDPDRTKLPWEPPSFVHSKDPCAQREKVVSEEIDIGSLKLSGNTFARVLHRVLDEEDCAELISCVNRKGFTPALINVGGGSQMLRPDLRDGHRAIVDSPELSQWLMDVIRPYLPAHAPHPWNNEKSDLVDLNERCRFLMYTPGQSFAPHCDGLYERPRGHVNSGDFSRVTVQLYLHDVPKENGGGTTFLDDRETPVATCQPGAGSVLIFSQDLYHEGSLLEAGLKYTLRTEAMYRRTKSDIRYAEVARGRRASYGIVWCWSWLWS
jgi:hypothetical protein